MRWCFSWRYLWDGAARGFCLKNFEAERSDHEGFFAFPAAEFAGLLPGMPAMLCPIFDLKISHHDLMNPISTQKQG
jgi:hypothetical protein